MTRYKISDYLPPNTIPREARIQWTEEISQIEEQKKALLAAETLVQAPIESKR